LIEFVEGEKGKINLMEDIEREVIVMEKIIY
jgi:hypothetical protein